MKRLFLHEDVKMSEVKENHWFLYNGILYLKTKLGRYNALGYDEKWKIINPNKIVEVISELEGSV